MKKLVFSVLLVNLLAACAVHTPFSSSSAAKQEPATTSAVEPAKVDSVPTTDVNAQALTTPETTSSTTAEAAATADASSAVAAADAADPLNDPASALAKRNVHFPFDVDAIQESDKATVQAHGAYLGSHPEHNIRVEGNADERGSSEYNLALGQRRANNTRKALTLSGAKVDQIETISFGEEKPMAIGHDETSWTQNRRADIIYK